MCGIAGVVQLLEGSPARPSITQTMLDHSAHRGPDDGALYAASRAVIGNRRLAIQDVAGGSQPVANEGGSIHVVLNGEIYCFVKLREQLQRAGHRFRSRCDTEVLVHGYEEWGIEGLLARLDGMFAFALLDERRDEFYLARDRLGIKPLFYTEQSNQLLFASEPRALVASGYLPALPDPVGVRLFLELQYIPAPYSPVRDLYKLLPGHYLRVSKGQVERPVRYWSPPTGFVTNRSLEEWQNELEQQFTQAVRSHLTGDFPVGIFLSGGLDSSILLGLMSRETGTSVPAFSIGFDESRNDETKFARIAAERFGADLTTLHIDSQSLDEVMHHFSHRAAEPIADAAFVPTLILSREARQRVKVVQSGDGADELFAGYHHYQRYSGYRARLAELLRRQGRAAARFFKPGSTATRQRSRFTGYPYIMAPGSADAFLVDLPVGPWPKRHSLHAIERDHAEIGGGLDPLSKALLVDLQGWLPADVLTKLDRASMAYGLEARVPFLDDRVVKFASSLPPEFKRRNGIGKWLLRQTYQDLLGPELVHRAKHGFSVPMAEWLRGPLRDRTYEALGPDAAKHTAWLDTSATTALLETGSGRIEQPRAVWALFVLVEWFRGLQGIENAGVRTVSTQVAPRVSP